MAQLEYAYFPGCSADSTGISYTKSAGYVCREVGIELKEIDDWCCCGTSAARITGDDLMHALPARSLALAEQQLPGLDVVAPCTGCYSALKGAVHWARQSEENRTHVSELIDMDYAATSDVKSLLELMCDDEISALVVERLKTTLGGMRIACYYGCTQVRPAEVVNFENPENPMAMERLLNACGAECVDWAFKTECCGASNHVVSQKVARHASANILRNAVENGAEAIVTSCPLCWLNIDMREKQINAELGTSYEVPVYYFTELIAMAMGASADEVGLQHHFTPAKALAAAKVCASAEADAADEGSLATASPTASPARDDEARHRRAGSAEAVGASSKDPAQNASRSDAPTSAPEEVNAHE